MRLATENEYIRYWGAARHWFYIKFRKEDYQCIGTLAEYFANEDGISLYNQSLPVKVEEVTTSKMTEFEYDWIRDLKYHRCLTCHDKARLRWFDKLYGEAICQVCGRITNHIPYKEYLKREDLL